MISFCIRTVISNEIQTNEIEKTNNTPAVIEEEHLIKSESLAHRDERKPIAIVVNT